MAVRADVEEIQTTRTEKLLAVVLAVFLLLGAIWTYQRLDDVIRQHEPVARAALFGGGPAQRRLERARERFGLAQRREHVALQQLELRREAYRTALEAHRPSATRLGARYDAAQGAYAASKRAAAESSGALRRAEPAAQAEQREAEHRLQDTLSRQDRDVFLVRLGLVGASIVLAYVLLAAMRRRTTRWFPLASSVVAAATIFAFVFASDYVTDYVNPFDWGIAFIAALGVASTLLAYWALERYIGRRLPQRRVRKGQCPFCGYPAGGGPHCEGCGREVVAPCAACEAPRRVGVVHCAACGR